MKIVVPYRFGIGEDALAVLRKAGEVVLLGTDSDAALRKELQDAVTVLVSVAPKVTRELIAAAPCLRHIARAGVGVDIVDIKAATERRVIVTNVPDASSDAVAEFAMTLLLSLAKNIISCDRAVKEGQWNKRLSLIQNNIELSGKTHGIVGLGRIGSKVALRCRAFGMNVLYYRRNRDLALEKATGVTYVPFDTLLRESDSISLHLPLTTETANLIDTPQFELMKRSVLLVNHSRAAVINKGALIRALQEGRIGGYGTDVYDNEPPDPNDELFSFLNVVCSPHLGGANRDTRARANLVLAEDVVRVIRGHRPINLVNPEALTQ